MAKRKVERRYLETLETRAVKGATEVWFVGCGASQTLRVYRGGPTDALRFREAFAEILQDTVEDWYGKRLSVDVAALEGQLRPGKGERVTKPLMTNAISPDAGMPGQRGVRRS